MEDKFIYILTNAEAGWDCIMSVHETIESIQKFYGIAETVDTPEAIEEWLNERDRALYVVFKRKLLP